MSLRRVLAAAAILLAAAYLRMCMPSLSAPAFSALRDVLGAEQLVLRLPEGAMSWPDGIGD